MKDQTILYITLNSEQEARELSRRLLDQNLANCTNWFPIKCMYKWKNKVEEEPEEVLMVKTVKANFKKIVTVAKSKISYTNCIAEIPVSRNRPEFEAWLSAVCTGCK